MSTYSFIIITHTTPYYIIFYIILYIIYGITVYTDIIILFTKHHFSLLFLLCVCRACGVFQQSSDVQSEVLRVKQDLQDSVSRECRAIRCDIIKRRRRLLSEMVCVCQC